MGVICQWIAAAITSYLFLCLGLMFAWPSSAVQIFRSQNTTLRRPMGTTEIALFGSLACIGALVATPITGYLLDKIGRKNCLFLPAISHVIAWSLVALSNRVEIVLFANFISGIGGVVFLIAPVYVGEICQQSIRGTVISGSIVFYVIGFLISYILGGTVDYTTMIYVCLCTTTVSLVLLTLLRESPVYLMKKGLEKEAANAIAFYRNAEPQSEEVLQEINVLRRAFNPHLELETELLPRTGEVNINDKTKPEHKLQLWKFIKKSRSTRRAMMVTVALITSAVFQGMVVLQVYAEPLFGEAVPTMSATLCSALLCIVTIVFGFVAAYLTDVLGRRPLMIYFSIAAGVCCVVLGSQLHLHWAPHWLTAVFIYVYCAAYTVGAGTVPFLLVAEVFLPEVRSFMSMFIIEWAWLCTFIVLFIFSPMVEAFGLGPVFYFFAAVAWLSAAFSAVYQPETKGLAVDAIQVEFLKKLGQKRFG